MPNPADLGKSSPSKHRWQLLLPTTLLTILLAALPILAQADDVEQQVQTYLDRIFDPSNDGVFVDRNSTLHRMTPPFLVAHAWPSCQNKINGILDDFDGQTGIHFFSDRDNLAVLFSGTDAKFSAVYLEYSDFNAYLNSGTAPYLEKLHGSSDMPRVNTYVKENLEHNVPAGIGADYSSKTKYQTVVIMTPETSRRFTCESIARYYLFEIITNLHPYTTIHEFDDLDFSFIRAINDPSIDANEAEDRAKEKLFILMTNDLKGQKNAEPR